MSAIFSMEGPSVSASRKMPGICQSCLFFPECSLRRDKETPVCFCELFECTSDVESSAREIDLDHCPGDSNPEFCDRSLKGLCMNCENRTTCRYPRQEGGVWHCSDYK